MKDKILIVDDDSTILKTIELGLGLSLGTKLDLMFAENGAEAIDTLKNNHVAVVVTDLYMPEVDGFELLAYMTRHHPETPCIVMTAFSGSEALEHLGSTGVFRFLEKPFSIADLSNTITDAINLLQQDRPQELLALSALIKLLQADRKTCTLEISNADDSKALLYLVDGVLCDAEYGALQGEEAVIHILNWDKASFNITDIPIENLATKIKANLDELISKAAAMKHSRDKGGKKAVKPPSHEELLFQAIQKAQSGNSKQALSSLAKLLKENPRESKAWLWFARTSENFKTINTALKNASLLAPQDQQIKMEIEKAKSAVAAGCGDSDSVVHCFSCWAPVCNNQPTCHYCNAQLDINEEMFRSSFFDSREEPETKTILESFQRFSKAAILDHKNPKTHFLLAMTHINLNQWEEALEELTMAVSLDPSNKEYQRKLDILSDFMNNLDSFFDEDHHEEEISAPPKKNKKIMVVEDSATTRNVIVKMLTQEGYEVVTAKDGIEAVARFPEANPDLILLDIIMPGMDGYETLATLKKKHNLGDTPVIMLTAKDSLLDKVKGKMSGSTEYLTKPFNALELIRKIKTHINA
jgi:twitching motility two-component system response regulator PilG